MWWLDTDWMTQIATRTCPTVSFSAHDNTITPASCKVSPFWNDHFRRFKVQNTNICPQCWKRCNNRNIEDFEQIQIWKYFILSQWDTTHFKHTSDVSLPIFTSFTLERNHPTRWIYSKWSNSLMCKHKASSLSATMGNGKILKRKQNQEAYRNIILCIALCDRHIWNIFL